jgi:mannan endo-1,4-beta-mannosidase
MALNVRARLNAQLVFGISAVLLSGCGARHVDIIELGTPADPCTALSADACAADTQHGCSLQPNPTGCTTSNPSCGVGTCAGGDPFVRRTGETLTLHNAPFSFVGSVSWGLAFDDNGCKISAYSSQTDALGPSFDDLANMHASVLRFWAFQSYAGSSGTDFSHFDRLVTAARAAGVRLIPVLENMQKDCSSGNTIDDTWFSGGYRSPYGSYALSYRDYVAALAAHFSAEPTIIAWELMHEASGDQFAALDGFAGDMTTLIRAADANHLIALGLNNGNAPATSTDGDPSNYFKLQNRAEIDLIDVQDFNAPSDPYPAQAALCRKITHALGKVAFIGASTAALSDSSSSSLQTRASQISAKLGAALDADFWGYLVYDYNPKWQTAGYDFDARSGDPLAGPDGVLAQRAPKY